MKNSTRVLIVLMAALSVLLVAAPACATDHSVSFKISEPFLLGLEYERGLSDSTSCCFVLGYTPFLVDIIGINLGMRWYDDNSLMDGKYYGLYAGYIVLKGTGAFFGASEGHLLTIQGILGYKKVYNIGFTLDAGLGPIICYMPDEGIIFGANVALMLGYSW